MRLAALDWHIPESTLRHRVLGTVNIHEAKEATQLLSANQELFLKDWILHEEVCGRAPSPLQVRAFANRILKEGAPPGENVPTVGQSWPYRFIQRHPEIKMKPGKTLSAARAQYTTPGAVVNWFKLLQSHITKYNIKVDNIANMDEQGLQEGETRGGRVMGTKVTKRAYLKASDATFWVTIVEAIMTSGWRLTPVVIFKGKSLQAQWFPPKFPP